MYKDYFRLSEMPFSIAPDPRFLFMSDRHREALAHLLYGVQGEGGIVLLTGEVGTGKTTICRSLLEQLPANTDIAFIVNPLMSAEELLQTICEEYRVNVASDRPGTKAYVAAIHGRLLNANAAGRRALLIVDEAQNLDARVLEQLRLLTNLETNTRKLLQIILIGQPELQDLLARPEMRQVAQRVVARYHLTQLSAGEVPAYVAHRLRVAGASPALFPEKLVRRVYRASGGVPRLINLVCDRALLGTYVRGEQQVGEATLRQAISEVFALKTPAVRTLPWALAAGLLFVVATGAYLLPDLSDAYTAYARWLPASAQASATPLALPGQAPGAAQNVRLDAPAAAASSASAEPAPSATAPALTSGPVGATPATAPGHGESPAPVAAKQD